MPEISRFFGIVIAIFYNDHTPPHFHARYGGERAILSIETLGVLEGSLPPRALGLVTEWAAMHRDELTANWGRAREKLPLVAVAPLE